ncbi:hypothetical protein MNEG_13164, partial [Monoraphidium neglectum]
RVARLEALSEALLAQAEGGGLGTADQTEVERVLPKLMAALDDGHFKVCAVAAAAAWAARVAISLAGLGAVQAALRAAPRAVEPALDKLMPLLFLKLCAAKESMRGAAEAALQGCALQFGADALLPALNRSLDAMKQPAAKVSVMEFAVLFIGEGKVAGVPLASLHLRQWVARGLALLLDKNAGVRRMAAKALGSLHDIDPPFIASCLAHASAAEALAFERALAAGLGTTGGAGGGGVGGAASRGPSPGALAEEGYVAGSSGGGGGAESVCSDDLAAAAGYSYDCAAAACGGSSGQPAAGSPGPHAGGGGGVPRGCEGGGDAYGLNGGYQQQQQPARHEAVLPAAGSSWGGSGYGAGGAVAHAGASPSAAAVAAPGGYDGGGGGLRGGSSGGGEAQRDVLGRPFAEPATPQQPCLDLPADAAGQARHLTVLVHRLQSRAGEDVLAELAACAEGAGQEAWDANFSKVLLAALAATKHASERVREAAFALVRRLAQHQPGQFGPVLDVVVQPLLLGCADPSREVLMAAHQALEALVDAMPPQRCLEALRFKLPTAEAVHSGTAVDGDVLCAAIRCLQRAAARAPPDELMALAPGALLPGLFAAFQHPRPDVRKVVVFCLVEMWLHIGESLTPYLSSLSTSQLKLLTIYYSRAQEAREAQQRRGDGRTG